MNSIVYMVKLFDSDNRMFFAQAFATERKAATYTIACLFDAICNGCTATILKYDLDTETEEPRCLGWIDLQYGNLPF